MVIGFDFETEAKKFVEERSQQHNFFSREICHLYRHHQTLPFCTMYYTTMYYILYICFVAKFVYEGRHFFYPTELQQE